MLVSVSVCECVCAFYACSDPQPIPPPNLDLTLVATSKFIGCCYLATSQDYVVVVTKGDTEELSTSGTSWLL